jgi:hypothetical protein
MNSKSCVSHDLFFFSKSHDCANYNMFHDFTAYAIASDIGL